MLLLLALNPLSCEAYKNTNPVGQRALVKIDVDGSGPLAPFPVTCEFYSKYCVCASFATILIPTPSKPQISFFS